jgi:hypothetical protein
MSATKEPLYMKWWVWIAIFLVTAVIVNYTTDDVKMNEDSPTNDDFIIVDEEMDLIDKETALSVGIIDHLENREVNEHVDDIDDQTPVTLSIGTELPAGEYFVLTQKEVLGYVLLTRSRHLTPEEIIWQKHFENHTLIYIREGEYLTTKNATLIPVDRAIVPNFEDGILKAGTYRVGIDIPPGVYTLFPTHDRIGFFSTAATSHQLNAHTIQQRNFNEPITIALNTGDYFTMLRAEIKK